MPQLVFFDLDGTILHGLSAENRFVLHLIRKGYIKLPQWINTIKFIFSNFSTFKHYVFIKNKAYLSGLSVHEISDLAAQFADRFLAKVIRPNLMKQIEQHQQAGDLLFLITGAPSFLAKAISKHLKISHVEPTYCAEHNGLFTSEAPTQHPFGQEKLNIAKKICDRHGTDIHTTTAYGNSYNDRILLSAVGCPVAVTPDYWLRKIARAKGWKILDDHGLIR